jgi:hypothetical protein
MYMPIYISVAIQSKPHLDHFSFYLQTCITLADFGCCLRERNLDGYTGLELLEKLKKTNNELGQVEHAIY